MNDDNDDLKKLEELLGQVGASGNNPQPAAPTDDAPAEPLAPAEVVLSDTARAELEKEKAVAQIVEAEISGLNVQKESEPVAPLSEEVESEVKVELNNEGAAQTESEPVIAGVEHKDKEKIRELESEIGSFVKKNNELPQTAEQEVAIGVGQTPLSPGQYQQQPTIVLPITKEQEDEGEKKSVMFGLRWLVTLAQKLKKIFKGNFKYKEVDEKQTS